MIMVSIGTFSWESIRNLGRHPKRSSIVMIATVVVVVLTHDLAKGVLVGVLLSALFFSEKVGQVLHVGSESSDEGRLRIYTVVGQVFFASAEAFVARFDFKEVVEGVRIDVGQAHFWDITAINALDRVVLKFRREGAKVEIVGMTEASATLVDKLSVHDKPDAVKRLMGH
jgi:SulP family sulfate permease